MSRIITPPEHCLDAAAAHVKSFTVEWAHTDQVVSAHVVHLRRLLAVDQHLNLCL
jgi:hypothetical protein